MKTLTIKEPWTSLIINGYKKYEFRSWKTNYRGKILIHAGKSLEKDQTIKSKRKRNLNRINNQLLNPRKYRLKSIFFVIIKKGDLYERY